MDAQEPYELLGCHVNLVGASHHSVEALPHASKKYMLRVGVGVGTPRARLF